MIEYLNAQSTDEWLDSRRGVLTASNFKTARSRTRKGEFTLEAQKLAMNIAREQLGGISPRKYQNDAMRIGKEEEENAFAEYENQRFEFPKQAGLITTDDRLFGCSPDGVVGRDGGIEIKTMVSSETLFKCWGDGDIDEYKDQCLGAMWLLDREWWDLCLWAYDMPDPLKIIRIWRNEKEEFSLLLDLAVFMDLVNEYKFKLKKDAEPYFNGHILMDRVESRKWQLN